MAGTISHAYGARHALTDIILDVAPASFTALSASMAPARARCSAGYAAVRRFRTGRIRIFGHDIGQNQRSTAVLGVVFQPRTLDLDLSVDQICSIMPPFTASPGVMRVCGATRC